MDAFIHDATEQNREDWELLKVKYANKTATPYEQMQVGGYYRMEMIFKLLTQDFLEQHSIFETDPTVALSALSTQIAAMASLDLDFTEFTMKDLLTKGYIQMEASQGKTRFFWVHHSRQIK